MGRIVFNINDELLLALKIYCARNRITMTDYILNLIEKELGKKK